MCLRILIVALLTLLFSGCARGSSSGIITGLIELEKENAKQGKKTDLTISADSIWTGEWDVTYSTSFPEKD